MDNATKPIHFGDVNFPAFQRGVEDGLIEQGMVHAENYTDEVYFVYYERGYEFGQYLHRVMSVEYVEVRRC